MLKASWSTRMSSSETEFNSLTIRNYCSKGEPGMIIFYEIRDFYTKNSIHL